MSLCAPRSVGRSSPQPPDSCLSPLRPPRADGDSVVLATPRLQSGPGDRAVTAARWADWPGRLNATSRPQGPPGAQGPPGMAAEKGAKVRERPAEPSPRRGWPVPPPQQAFPGATSIPGTPWYWGTARCHVPPPCLMSPCSARAHCPPAPLCPPGSCSPFPAGISGSQRCRGPPRATRTQRHRATGRSCPRGGDTAILPQPLDAGWGLSPGPSFLTLLFLAGPRGAAGAPRGARLQRAAGRYRTGGGTGARRGLGTPC